MSAAQMSWHAVVPKPVFRLLDVVELYVPALAFLTLFIVFNAQIFARYILHSPLSWSTEISQLAFVWTALLGASYMRRMHGHIAFDMVFEMYSERGKVLATMASNMLVAIACIGSVPPTIEYLTFLGTEYTPMLHIPFSYGFAPLLVFLVMVGAYSVLDILSALSGLARGAA